MLDDSTDRITPAFADLLKAETRGELGEAIYAQVSKFSFLDLHVLGTALQYELSGLPSPYREAVEPYLAEQVLGRYYHILAMHSDGSFGAMSENIRDLRLFRRFCQTAIDFGAAVRESGDESLQHAQLGGLSYFLLHCFALFVLEEPGHPVGMPFPDGTRVTAAGKVFYCPARGREKDRGLELCEFCPARQAIPDHTD